MLNNCFKYTFFLSFQSVAKCPGIAAPSHGMVFPSTCQKPAGVNYTSECFFMCNVTVGYQLEGASKVSCLESGSWSDDTTKTICRGKMHCILKTVRFTEDILLSFHVLYRNQENEIFFFPLILLSQELDVGKRGNTADNGMHTNVMSCCMARSISNTRDSA